MDASGWDGRYTLYSSSAPEITKVPIEEVAQATATVEALTRAYVTLPLGDGLGEERRLVRRALCSALKAIDAYYSPVGIVTKDCCKG